MRSEYFQPPTTGSIGPLVPLGGLPLAGPGLQAASDWSAGPGVSSAAAGGWLGGRRLELVMGRGRVMGSSGSRGCWRLPRLSPDHLSGAREAAEAARLSSMTRPSQQRGGGRVSPDLSS